MAALTSSIRFLVYGDDREVYLRSNSLAFTPWRNAAHSAGVKNSFSPSSRPYSHNWGWSITPYGKSVWFQLIAWP
jgi:hypothetical protein